MCTKNFTVIYVFPKLNHYETKPQKGGIYNSTQLTYTLQYMFWLSFKKMGSVTACENYCIRVRLHSLFFNMLRPLENLETICYSGTCLLEMHKLVATTGIRNLWHLCIV